MQVVESALVRRDVPAPPAPETLTIPFCTIGVLVMGPVPDKAALTKAGLPEEAAANAAKHENALGGLGGLLNLLKVVQTQAPQLASLLITLIQGFGGTPGTSAAGQPRPQG